MWLLHYILLSIVNRQNIHNISNYFIKQRSRSKWSNIRKHNNETKTSVCINVSDIQMSISCIRTFCYYNNYKIIFSETLLNTLIYSNYELLTSFWTTSYLSHFITDVALLWCIYFTFTNSYNHFHKIETNM